MSFDVIMKTTEGRNYIFCASHYYCAVCAKVMLSEIYVPTLWPFLVFLVHKSYKDYVSVNVLINIIYVAK